MAIVALGWSALKAIDKPELCTPRDDGQPNLAFERSRVLMRGKQTLRCNIVACKKIQLPSLN